MAFAEGVLFWFCKDQFNLSIFLISSGWFFLLLYFTFDALQYLLGYGVRGAMEQSSHLRII
tara:strand:- start:1 stop:183 length:183 start_codon:yes stop_codon:yes gene_type:complete